MTAGLTFGVTLVGTLSLHGRLAWSVDHHDAIRHDGGTNATVAQTSASAPERAMRRWSGSATSGASQYGRSEPARADYHQVIRHSEPVTAARSGDGPEGRLLGLRGTERPAAAVGGEDGARRPARLRSEEHRVGGEPSRLDPALGDGRMPDEGVAVVHVEDEGHVLTAGADRPRSARMPSACAPSARVQAARAQVRVRAITVRATDLFTPTSAAGCPRCALQWATRRRRAAGRRTAGARDRGRQVGTAATLG